MRPVTDRAWFASTWVMEVYVMPPIIPSGAAFD
jgi:hypothetical protein